MSEHEYHEVTVPANAPTGNRAGLSPTCADLEPFFLDGWRINQHHYTGDGHVRVRLFRQKPAPVAKTWPEQVAEEAVIIQMAKAEAKAAAARSNDLRSPGEKASDAAHLAKLRAVAEANMPPSEWRDRWLAGQVGAQASQPLRGRAIDGTERGFGYSTPIACPTPPDAAHPFASPHAAEEWLLDMGAHIAALDLKGADASRLRAAAVNLAICYRLACRVNVVPDTAARAAWGTLG